MKESESISQSSGASGAAATQDPPSSAPTDSSVVS
jgi:hypothetical protein